MARIGFWQLLLDDRVSWWEARAINSAQDEADVALGNATAAQFSVDQLRQRVTQMSREIVMLRAAVTVLVNTLRDTNVIDPELLDRRLEAALDEATGATDATEKAQQPANVTCIRCRQQVPPSKTNMTADGPVCDSH